MTPTTPPPNLTPEEQRQWQAIWEKWYATRQPEPMPVDELPAITLERAIELYNELDERQYYEMMAANGRIMELRTALMRIASGEPIDPRTLAREVLRTDSDVAEGVKGQDSQLSTAGGMKKVLKSEEQV